MSQSTATTTREVEVTRIPSGEAIRLPAGLEVVITQALGGSFTILVPSLAGLYRLEGVNADAIGQTAAAAVETTPEGGIEQAIWDQLRTCYDPEIPVNIVDLGLIYGLEIDPKTLGGASVLIKMTLTAPGCGMGPVIAAEARQKVLTLDSVANADVELVWEPAWSPERITEAGKQKLGMV